ncbi:MAG: GspE/PulE family protein [Planctomycetota bacterium]
MTRETPFKPFIEQVPHAYAREHLVLGVERGGEPVILHAPTTPPWIRHNIRTRLGLCVPCEAVPEDRLASAIDAAYRDAMRSADSLASIVDDADAIGRGIAERAADLLATGGKSDTARFLDAVVFEAITRGASDLHIHPTDCETLVRFRTDGVLVDARTLPRSATDAVISRLKVLGGMDSAEIRSPQDGRATVTLGSSSREARGVDLRISTIPTEEGERAVVRILDTDRGSRLADLDAIGMAPDIRAVYERLSCRPNGMILLTGPTGSGKTTTLYATLRRIAAGSSGGVSPGVSATHAGSSMNIMTVEDPVEYRLSAPGITISQSQVNRRKGMSFASGLRHILRQDPDVVMVGEVRDAETAGLAIQAALTGHLVFSTLHTNDAVGAPPRLIDLGAEPYLVSAALTAVMAQRLVRTRHAACDARGCEECLGTGLRGRTGIFELFVLDEDSREMIAQAASAVALRRYAAERGVRSLRADGLRLERLGMTTRTEVERVTVDLAEIAEARIPEPAAGAVG